MNTTQLFKLMHREREMMMMICGCVGISENHHWSSIRKSMVQEELQSTQAYWGWGCEFRGCCSRFQWVKGKCFPSNLLTFPSCVSVTLTINFVNVFLKPIGLLSDVYLHFMCVKFLGSFNERTTDCKACFLQCIWADLIVKGP